MRRRLLREAKACVRNDTQQETEMANTVSLIFANEDKGVDKLVETADENFGIMEWTGQKCHRKDHLVGKGTLIFYRPDKKEFSFIGKVLCVVLMEEGDRRAHEPNKYKLIFEKCAPPEGLRTSKQCGETHYHTPIFLSLGFDIRSSRMQGIYAR
jgi:hypothetical protein